MVFLIRLKQKIQTGEKYSGIQDSIPPSKRDILKDFNRSLNTLMEQLANGYNHKPDVIARLG